jgi:hypothetical protein|eukprot:g12597.t1
MWFSCDEIKQRPKRRVILQPETSVSQIFKSNNTSPKHRSSVRVNVHKYEKKIHDDIRHEAFAVLSDTKKGDPILRHPIRGTLARKKILKTSTLTYDDDTAAGCRPSNLLRGEGDSVTAWRPSLIKNVGHTNDNITVAGKASKDVVYQHAARDSPHYSGIKTNNFSAISRADERNIVVDDIYENEYKQKKKFTRRDSLSSNLLVSDETHLKQNLSTPRKSSKKIDLQLSFENSVSPKHTSYRVIHTNIDV